MIRQVFHGILAAAAVAMGCAAAHADIKAFNAAMKAGDYKAAAAQAEDTWKTWNISDEQTAILAREFGFVSYVAGEYRAAQRYGQFLKEKGASLTPPDDQSSTSAVLLAAAEYRLAVTPQTRKALFDALAVRAAQDGIDNISALAVEALYRGDFSNGDWAGAKASAKLAVSLFEKAGAQLVGKRLEAGVYAAVAGFQEIHSKSDYEAVVDAHDAIIDALDATADPALRKSLTPLKYQAEAWALAIEAAFRGRAQIGSNIPRGLNERELKKPKTPPFATVPVEDDPAYCKGQLDASELRYPGSAAFKGQVGAVIVRFDFDANGAPTAFEQLAAVPAAQFGPAVMTQAPSMRWERRSGDRKGCRLDGQSRIMRFFFVVMG